MFEKTFRRCGRGEAPASPVPGPAFFFRGSDMGGRSTSEFGNDNWDQCGISATLRVPQLDTDFGFYYVHFKSKGGGHDYELVG